MCIPYVLTTFFLLGLDGLYLALNQNYLESSISRIQNAPLQINWVGLILCYWILISGVYYFIVRPNKSYLDAFLMGVFVMGVYETTNYATLTKWKPEMVVMDTLWGGILFALTAFFVKLSIKKLDLKS